MPCPYQSPRQATRLPTRRPRRSAAVRRWCWRSVMADADAKTHLSLADVEHVAALARLGLTDEEKVRMAEQLSSILDHISALNRLDTSAIPPTAQVIELANVMRAD